MIELKNLTKQFGDKLAVDDMNMQLKPGHVVGLIGQNGAGKTTTFRMMLDFIQPTKGTISWDGHPIMNEDRQNIGFLPEERGLYQKVSVEQQVVYFAELHGMKKSDAKQQLNLWMKKLDVVGKVSDKVQSLSKGNAQKVQLIATVITEPSLLILDEPFTGLDPVNTQLMMNEILRLKQNGAHIIFSSHNMSGVEKLSDELLMLKHGKTVLSGELNTIRESFGRSEIYLESSVTDEQLLAIPGVLDIQSEGVGRHLKLGDPNAGKEVFSVVAKDGYVPVFSQQPPTLDEIFRREVTGRNVYE
ncbi:ABC transporter ATP-binding protein [Weissella hellenica]|uniref:ABC transporter ATP-binding protein n=1 Tax=Weissella hellenica TaxID=46256 RepID=UPI00388389F4